MRGVGLHGRQARITSTSPAAPASARGWSRRARVAAPRHTISAVEMIGGRLVKTVTRHLWQKLCYPEFLHRHTGDIFTHRCV
jgi:hypothetical protein